LKADLPRSYHWADGSASTPFMSFGDRIEIEMCDDNGESIFAKIDQVVVQYTPQG
jgi:fumarylacetoacetate (FAA) hydrolase